MQGVKVIARKIQDDPHLAERLSRRRSWCFGGLGSECFFLGKKATGGKQKEKTRVTPPI